MSMLSSADSGITKWGSHCIVRYSSSNPCAAEEQLKSGKADGISISPWGGFSEASLDRICGLSGVKIVVLDGLPNLPLEPLQSLPQLEELSIGDTAATLDLALFPMLRRLSVSWHKNIFKNSQQSAVSSLHVWKYKSAKNDLTEFPEFPDLKELELVQSSIRSLNGISQHSRLSRIELHNLTKLETLGELHFPELIVFIADACKKIVDHEQLSTCASLEELKLHDCGVIKSLCFIDALKSLKSFRFMRTDVLDGDLSPLMRLDDVYFTEKRHFSHKTGDMKQRP